MMGPGRIVGGILEGAGAAVNVQTGFVPDMVMLINSRGATETVFFASPYTVVGFDSGGTTEILPGDDLADATAGGTGTVVQVTLQSGTWAGGDAAGYLVLKDVAGTITNNNEFNIVEQVGKRAAVAGVATVDGSVVNLDVDIDSEVGTPAAVAVVDYAGTSGANSAGFTISAGALVSGEFIQWTAIRYDRWIGE